MTVLIFSLFMTIILVFSYKPVATYLFINDNADDIYEVIHLKASGENFMKWNNTGIYRDFACTNGSIHIPEKFKPKAKNKIWTVYSYQKKLTVAIHSSSELSILSIFKYQDAKKLIELNPDLAKLKTEFQFPTGKLVEYDINSTRNKWIITAVNGNKIDRDFYKCPLISGNLNY
ncbi:MAG: hypothetical protein DRJ07_00890 [Bacteroidetes bacterium]|nr:MAG: hypothetical protein DRJ07_00890 [Bacteroidota bacterium]